MIDEPRVNELLARVAVSSDRAVSNLYRVLARGPTALRAAAEMADAIEAGRLPPCRRTVMALEVALRARCR